jgi:hypothetical protein
MVVATLTCRQILQKAQLPEHEAAQSQMEDLSFYVRIRVLNCEKKENLR